MKNIFNLVRFILGLTLLIVMIYFSLNRMKNQYCNIDKIEIEMVDGHEFITEGFLKEYLNQNTLNPENIKINDVSFKAIEEILENHPSIKEAKVYSDMFGNVSLHVTQRRPIIRVQNNNIGYYIDEDGIRMPFSEMYAARMLLATGDINSVQEVNLFSLSDYIYNNQFLRKQIVQIDISDSRLLMLTRIGERIEFGEITNIEKKFEKLMLYYKKGNQQNKKYRIINLEYNNQIVCKK